LLDKGIEPNKKALSLLVIIYLYISITNNGVFYGTKPTLFKWIGVVLWKEDTSYTPFMSTQKLTTELNNVISKSKIETLVTFSINICERLITDYVFFYNKNNWGNPEILNKAIKYCEETQLSQVDSQKVKFLISEVEKVTPDTEDFEDIEVSYALNSACSVLDLLEFIIKEDKIYISNISSYITDTIDFKIQEIESGLTDEELENHPKIVEEKKRQLEYLKVNGA